MPVREIGGISRANLAGVLGLARQANTLVAGFNANQAISGARISILTGKKSLFSQTADLTPEHAWIHELPLTDSEAKYTFEIRDAAGTTLIRQAEGEYNWAPESEIHIGPQPSYHIPDPDQRSYDDWMQLGKDEELNGRALRALNTYQEALRRFPGSFAASKSAGRLAASLLRFEEAKPFLELPHSRDTSDPEISYYLGTTYEALGETEMRRPRTRKGNDLAPSAPLHACDWENCWRGKEGWMSRSAICSKRFARLRRMRGP